MDNPNMEREIQNRQANNIHADINRFKVVHVITNEEQDAVSVGIYDTRTNTGINFNLVPSMLGCEPESEDGLPLRYVAQVVTVGRKGTLEVEWDDVIDPTDWEADSRDVYPEVK